MLRDPASSTQLAKAAPREVFAAIASALDARVVGQPALTRRLLVALLCDGHALVEGVPGLAKTTAVKTLAELLEADFHRIQFTPDLLPADLTGTEVFRAETGTFEFRPGPLFRSLVLADEINRAPAKVQSALLEAMQEHQVSIGGHSLGLPEPFLVLATQNPLEHEGTYPLPEAQLDRFALKLLVGYPSREQELAVLERMAHTQDLPRMRRVVGLDHVRRGRGLVERVACDARLKQYVVDLVFATREPARAGLQELVGRIQYGASPRATIWLVLAARANALLEGRGFVTPGDIKRMAPAVLRHRVLPTYEADAEGLSADALVARVLETVPVP